MKQLLHTPEGVRDIYGSDYSQKLRVEDVIHSLFISFGYEDIQTPGLEYFDVFSSNIGTTDTRSLYRFTDDNGDTLVLRSDFTPSIARCASKYLNDGRDVLRFTYKGNTFSNKSALQGKLKETTQMGIELIGDESVEADVEVIKLAIESMSSSGLKNYKLCIGNVDYYKGLCDEFGFSNEIELTLRDYVSDKNYVEAKEYLNSEGIEASVIENILGLNNLVGGLEALNKAKDLTGNKTSLAAVERLIQVYEALDKEGLCEHIFFDLGMLSNYLYYTGIIFKGYTYGIGDCVVKGGRYDNLMSKFGTPAPAIGFCIVVDDLLTALNSTEDGEYLTFALTKGRLAEKTLSLLESIGITCEEMKDKNTRKLIFVNEELKLKFFLSKGPDVPTYVEYGAADIGVVGKDTIIEENRRVYEVLDLGFGKCRMCVCGPKEAEELLKHREMIRVCSKYPVIAKDYFYNKKHQTVDIIKLNGSVELGPIVNLGDVIVDIVETGSTLRENGLAVLEEICNLSARVVVNQVSMQMQNERIRTIINKLKEKIEA